MMTTHYKLDEIAQNIDVAFVANDNKLIGSKHDLEFANMVADALGDAQFLVSEFERLTKELEAANQPASDAPAEHIDIDELANAFDNLNLFLRVWCKRGIITEAQLKVALVKARDLQDMVMVQTLPTAFCVHCGATIDNSGAPVNQPQPAPMFETPEELTGELPDHDQSAPAPVPAAHVKLSAAQWKNLQKLAEAKYGLDRSVSNGMSCLHWKAVDSLVSAGYATIHNGNCKITDLGRAALAQR